MLDDWVRKIVPSGIDIDKILATYPRCRKPLPVEYIRIFESEYQRNRSGFGRLGKIVQYLESWMHMRTGSEHPCTLLELGAGTLNHVKYESGATVYDIVEPSEYLLDRKRLARLRNIYLWSEDIKVTRSYDRIVSVAVLEHMTDLPTEVARSALLLKDQGKFQAGIPNEGALIWNLAWRTTTGLAFRIRTGLRYARVMEHEHVNTAQEIIRIVQYFFGEVNVEYFPVSVPCLGLYVYIEARKPKRNIATEWLADKNKGLCEYAR